MVARAVVLLAVSLAAAGGAADAGAAMRVVDVPGVSGRSVQIAAAGRLADGGAIVAGTLTPSGGRRRARPRIVVVRLRHDGLIDASFGESGVVTAQLARGDGRAGSRATSVAVDPARGRSWVGAAVGGNEAGAVLALDSRGRRVTRFGTGSVVRFDGDATAPVALAYGGGRLAAAATRRPCRGCQVLLLDPGTGARRGQQALAPVPDVNAGRCPGAVLGSLALAGASRIVLGGSGGAATAGAAAAGGAGAAAGAGAARGAAAAAGAAAAGGAAAGDACSARLVVRDGSLRPVAVQDPGDDASRTVVAAAGPPLDLCVGIEARGAARLVRVAAGAQGPAATALPKRTWTPVAGTLAGVVPLGDRACGALLRRAGKPAFVLQASNGSGKPSVTEAPAGLRAGAIYRCKQHVLVVGTRRRGGVDRASVAVTSIARR